MDNIIQKQVRDPVCGMSVDPATAKYSYIHQGVSWYFCAENCQQQFITNPEQYLAATKVQAPATSLSRISWTREVLVWLTVFAVAVVLIAAARGFSKKAARVEPDSKITGAAAGSHQAIDNGQGGVIVEAKHDPDARNLEFVVSLNTHTVDLTDFDPPHQVRLHVGAQEYTPKAVLLAGDRSSHHQNYRLEFPAVDDRGVSVVVHDVGGVATRELPFEL
ncbi:MAG: YHS domain-containing protein [Candidatus Kerfeldbacteria bacterium]|nr:YHS domain-containing protein [Candidatus Kerfeldbacteria bacterium]